MPTNLPNVSYLLLKAVGQSIDEDQYLVLMGPLTKQQMAEMGMVKDSSVTKK